MKKIISLFLVLSLTVLTLSSCGSKPDIEDVKPRIIELIEASYEINDIFFGDGLDRVDYEAEYQKIIDSYAEGLAKAEQELLEAEQAYHAMMYATYEKTEEEIAAAKKRIEDAEKEVKKNTYMFTKEEFIAQYDTDLTYIAVRSDKYVTVNDIKDAAEKVYSASYLMSIYETMFVGYMENGMTDMIHARYYDGVDGLMILKDADVWVTAKRIYDYDSMKIVRPSNGKQITVEMDTHLEDESEHLTVRLSFVLQDGEWYLNSPSY